MRKDLPNNVSIKTSTQITKIIKNMTLKEKCSLLSGADFWHTKAIKRLGIPQIMFSDGPHGLRKMDESSEEKNFNNSIKSICFPAACSTSCSFDRELYKTLGETLGDECQAQDVAVILGPAINIKRSPLCGRNFEYISEDPYLTGELAAADINGVQSKNIGTSLKHFALNNQEYRRLTISSNADMRTMREIYLAGFETAIKKSHPYTIMHSYNLINGEFSGESKWLLTDLLRTEWGFNGLVMSDWGAVNDRVKGLAAGCDLEMPSCNGITDKEVETAIKKNKINKATLDESCFRILSLILNFINNKKEGEFDFKKHHEIAKKIESESIVLLKNKNKVLPLKNNKSIQSLINKSNKIALIGEFAQKPRYQGGGSSHINAQNVSSALDAFKKTGYNYVYSKGFEASPNKDETIAKFTADSLCKEALEIVKKCGTVIIFAGLPDSFESEGYDRRHIDLPPIQNTLISKIAAMKKKVIVVLHNGSPISMPWLKDVDAVVETYLGGEAVGEAVVDVLTGKVNPSGKLAETFPLRLEDTPSYPYFSNDNKNTDYREGIFVGYRYYDMKAMPVLFPFGYGLSYTNFLYKDISISKKNIKDNDVIKVKVTVQNQGDMDGKEIVQLYIADKTNTTTRPPKELKGFEKIFIRHGEIGTVEFTLDKRSFAWYNTQINDWYVATGDYDIMIGSSSRDIHLVETIHFTTSIKLPFTITMNTAIGDLMTDVRTSKIMQKYVNQYFALFNGGNETSKEAISEEMVTHMFEDQPLRGLKAYNNMTENEIKSLIKTLQQAIDK